MTLPLSIVMARLNGVAHIRDLLQAGFSRSQVAAMKNQGELIRPRIGWYVSPDSPDPVVRAVRVGGMLGCVSAAASYGLPTPGMDKLHVAVEPRASRLRSPRDSSAHPPAGSVHDVVLHWRDLAGPHERFRVGLGDALEQMAGCVDDEWLVAVVDGARVRVDGRRPLLDDAGLEQLRRGAGPALRRAIDRSIASAESPLESLARLRLATLGVEVRSQVEIGRFRADLVLDGWLVIECDGSTHAEASRFAADRERDAYFAAAGYTVLRFTYRQITTQWDSVVLPAVHAALASRSVQHLSDLRRRSVSDARIRSVRPTGREKVTDQDRQAHIS